MPGALSVRERMTEPAPRRDPLEVFDELLDAEASAARAADAEVLLALQAEKAEVLRAIEQSPLHDPVGLARLADKARANLPLVRSLVALHRALLGEARESTYGQHGALAAPAPPSRLSRSG